MVSVLLSNPVHAPKVPFSALSCGCQTAGPACSLFWDEKGSFLMSCFPLLLHWALGHAVIEELNNFLKLRN